MVTGCTQNEFESKSNFAGTLPGIGPYPKELTKKFEELMKVRGPDQKPRTRHLNADGTAKYINRLYLESSPYLLQHAHNPVNWYPWGDEAFELAKKLKRPVLLSIGYSTCHWCHVMEEESFEDEAIAAYLNQNYIAIKVDREERPDVDSVYMTAVQLITGSGGWPMTVWLNADRKPFYGATYIPPKDGDRGASMGFLTLLEKLKTAYSAEGDRITESTEKLVDSIRQIHSAEAGDSPIKTEEILNEAFDYYSHRYDKINGGLAGAPKFPSSLPIRFLLRFAQKNNPQNKNAMKMAQLTLQKMAASGMYDQIGSGFHRYSTDEQWLVPHFEKMLYDNALLALDYTEAYQATGEPGYRKISEEILHYIQGEMTSERGAFYSATDADSFNPKGEREEGPFFTWTKSEIHHTLDPALAKIVIEAYGMTDIGNFEGRNVLFKAKKLSPSEEQELEKARQILYSERLKRPLPLKDDKILTAWNGLMISAFSRAGFAFKSTEFISTAEKAAEYIWKNLYHDGILYRTHDKTKAKIKGYLEDYSFLAASFMDLYESSFDLKWIKRAIELDQKMAIHFEDAVGGFFRTGAHHEKLIAREKPGTDGAEPSGNSAAVMNLLRLYEFTTNPEYKNRAEKSLKAFSRILTQSPAAASEMLLALQFQIGKPKEIVIVTPKGKLEAAEGFLHELRTRFVPYKVLSVLEADQTQKETAKFIPIVDQKTPIDGKATAYICTAGICQRPTTEPADFKNELLK